MSSEHHGLNEPAGIGFVARSRFHHGRFGRLFRNLDPAQHSDHALTELAKQMKEKKTPDSGDPPWGGQAPERGKGDNPRIPAGYTYLGQFIDHDITFDPASALLRSNDPNALHNFRTPRFDLDSLYGEGPDDEPFMYQAKTDRKKKKFLIEDRGGGEFDLPRNSEGTALIGDPRNDENTIVSQLQTVMLRAHNTLVDELGDFDEARRQLRWHYQYVVVEDFLRKRIVPAKLMDEILPKGEEISWCEGCHCNFGEGLPFMPVEFSVGAYRFGHSMVRPSYDLNEPVGVRKIFDNRKPAEELMDLRGFRPLPAGWQVDWRKFFKTAEPHPQPSRLIDVSLAGELFELPFVSDNDEASLAARNLLRGKVLGLPWGEAVAKRLGETPLTPDQVFNGIELSERDREELEERTPLWFYVLREAENQDKKRTGVNGGEALGPVGGWIVAQTFICLLARDQFSYVNIHPNWTPKEQGLIPQAGDDFEMADLIRFATGE